MENKCKFCRHEKVCKFKETYEKQLAGLEKIKIKAAFKLELQCDNYEATWNSSSITGSRLIWQNTPTVVPTTTCDDTITLTNYTAADTVK